MSEDQAAIQQALLRVVERLERGEWRYLLRPFRTLVESAAETVDGRALTALSVQTIAITVVREQSRGDWRADVGLVMAFLTLIVAVLAYREQVVHDANPDPPPSVTVVVPQPDPAEIDRQVDERVREIEQQRQAEHRDADSHRHWPDR